VVVVLLVKEQEYSVNLLSKALHLISLAHSVVVQEIHLASEIIQQVEVDLYSDNLLDSSNNNNLLLLPLEASPRHLQSSPNHNQAVFQVSISHSSSSSLYLPPLEVVVSPNLPPLLSVPPNH